MRSGLKLPRNFASCLEPYLPGILADCRGPFGTKPVEGTNNKLSFIKRAAYGFRDDVHLFLKIRAAFSGVG
jgi:transposase